MRRARLRDYIDSQDLSSSTTRLLIWQALKTYGIRPLIGLLNDPEIVVRTAVARELQLRGGQIVWRICNAMCHSRVVSDRILALFILGQLGTPRLPYQKKSLELIDFVLHRERISAVTVSYTHLTLPTNREV